MSIMDIFSSYTNLNADEFNSFAENNKEGSYTILDVRQPSEYEQTRIPGARLIPLPELRDRIGELDPEKPVITY